ncbi:hypothetical protein [Gloeobacter kilaueensis]|uniref:Uncharacterized protein n=1 Tax=Gloeobacter kilaueensis (strain ATCC BAA-2537 / CCAP 1431/1 / ULC 316 / JS1) TaxID=1183438 RepID=U5QG43_GLOK1|nr:hypothetical protein [Gloeobacter kilaueensis]AGY57932.1 hypothetical protein GKIL_1686 [Gloeobacter kilaueensis JS1]
MFGSFQQSTVRVQVAAGAATIRRCLTQFDLVRRWAWTQSFPASLPEAMEAGLEFYSYFGPVPLGHRIARLNDNSLEMVLWQGVDGHIRWRWGDGWIQCTVAGVSLLPLALGQTAMLDSLTRFAASQETATAKAAPAA